MVWFHGISTAVGYLMPNPVFTYILDISFVNTFCRYTVKWSNSSICNNSIKHKSFFCTQLICQTVLYDPSGATTLGQSRTGSNGNEGVFHIPQNYKSGASPSDSFA